MYKNKYLKYKNKYLKLQNKVNLYTMHGGTYTIPSYRGIFTQDITHLLALPNTTTNNKIHSDVLLALESNRININLLKFNDKIIDYILIEHQNLQNVHNKGTVSNISKTIIDNVCNNDNFNSESQNKIYDDIFNINTINNIIDNQILIHMLSFYYKKINTNFIQFIFDNVYKFYNKVIKKHYIDRTSNIDIDICRYINETLFPHGDHDFDHNIFNSDNTVSDKFISYYNDDNTYVNSYIYDNQYTEHKLSDDKKFVTAYIYDKKYKHILNDSNINTLLNTKFTNEYTKVTTYIIDMIKKTPEYTEYNKYINIIITKVYSIICASNDDDYNSIITKFEMKYDEPKINYSHIDITDNIINHFNNNNNKIYKYIVKYIYDAVYRNLYVSISKKYFYLFYNDTHDNINIVKYVYMSVLKIDRNVNTQIDYNNLTQFLSTLIIPISLELIPDITKLKTLLTTIHQSYNTFITNSAPYILSTQKRKEKKIKMAHYYNLETFATTHFNINSNLYDIVCMVIIYNILFKYLCLEPKSFTITFTDDNYEEYSDDINPDTDDKFNNYLTIIFGFNFNIKQLNSNCDINTLSQYKTNLSSNFCNILKNAVPPSLYYINYDNINYIFMWYIKTIYNKIQSTYKIIFIKKLHNIIQYIIYTLEMHKIFRNRYIKQINKNPQIIVNNRDHIKLLIDKLTIMARICSQSSSPLDINDKFIIYKNYNSTYCTLLHVPIFTYLNFPSILFNYIYGDKTVTSTSDTYTKQQSNFILCVILKWFYATIGTINNTDCENFIQYITLLYKSNSTNIVIPEQNVDKICYSIICLFHYVELTIIELWKNTHNQFNLCFNYTSDLFDTIKIHFNMAFNNNERYPFNYDIETILSISKETYDTSLVFTTEKTKSMVYTLLSKDDIVPLSQIQKEMLINIFKFIVKIAPTFKTKAI